MKKPSGKLIQLILVGVGAVVLIGVAVISAGQAARLKLQLTSKERAIQSVQADHEVLQRQLRGLEDERERFEARVRTLEADAKSITSEFGEVQGSLSLLQLRYDDLRAEKSDLEVNVTRLTEERDDAVAQMEELEEQRSEVERTAARVRERWRFLSRDYRRLELRLAQLELGHVTGIPLGTLSPPLLPPDHETRERAPTMTLLGRSQTPNVKTPDQRAIQAGGGFGWTTRLEPQAVELPPIIVYKGHSSTNFSSEARVIDVNKTYRFVVIDKGATDGLVVGARLEMRRGGKRIGEVVAVRVRPQYAACDIDFSRTPESLQIGDVAILGGP